MGMFQVRVRVENQSAPERSFEDRFWVDTGAVYSLVPEDRLTAIGLAPSAERRLTYADGRVEKRGIASAVFQVEGISERMPCPVIFGAPGSMCLLGATALEAFGVDADPTSGKLKPTFSIIGGFRASR